jgi:hypothetical protein
MQLRVKRPGMSWDASGLNGILALRSLVLAERWCADSHYQRDFTSHYQRVLIQPT